MSLHNSLAFPTLPGPGLGWSGVAATESCGRPGGNWRVTCRASHSDVGKNAKDKHKWQSMVRWINKPQDVWDSGAVRNAWLWVGGVARVGVHSHQHPGTVCVPEHRYKTEQWRNASTKPQTELARPQKSGHGKRKKWDPSTSLNYSHEERCLTLLRLCPLLYGMNDVKRLNLKYCILSLCSVPRLTLTDVLTLNTYL